MVKGQHVYRCVKAIMGEPYSLIVWHQGLVVSVYKDYKVEIWTPPSFAPLMPTSSLFREQTLDLATGVSRSRVQEFGTVYWPHCGSPTLNLDTLNNFYRHFCLVRLRHNSNTLISMCRG